MPPKKKADPGPEPDQAELCGQCFPYGFADQPSDATQVSCSHGAWDVPAAEQSDGDGEGDGKQ